jgi:hypothetical protein
VVTVRSAIRPIQKSGTKGNLQSKGYIVFLGTVLQFPIAPKNDIRILV